MTFEQMFMFFIISIAFGASAHEGAVVNAICYCIAFWAFQVALGTEWRRSIANAAIIFLFINIINAARSFLVPA